MEQDKPKNFLILGYTLGIVVVLVATVIFVDQYRKADVRHEYEKKILQAPNLQYQDLRVAEDGRLSNYRWIDQSKGVVRLSKERASELVLKEWASRPEGVVAPAAEPAAPAAPAAPATGTPGAPTVPAATTPTAPAGTEPGAVAPLPTQHEPPGTAQPPVAKPGETPKKHPAQGTDGTKKDTGPGTDRSK